MRQFFGLAGLVALVSFAACEPAHIFAIGDDSGVGGEGTGGTGSGGVTLGTGGSGTGGQGVGGAGTGGEGTGGVGTGGVIEEPDAGAPEVSPAVDAGPPVAPIKGQLAITEIMPDCAAVVDDTGEWFEVHNVGEVPWNLRACTISDTTHSEVISRDVIVPPGGYATLARFGDAPTGGFTPEYAYGLVKFSDQGDVIRVVCGGAAVDFVDFTMFHLAQGFSLSLDPRATDPTLPASWCAGTAVYNTTVKGQDHGSPGMANPECP